MIILKIKTIKDTDSLMYGIKTEDAYESLCTDKEMFDFSNYPSK